MKLLGRFRAHEYVLVFLSVLGFTYAEGNLALLVLGLVMLGTSWWLVETRNARPVPRWLINLGVLLGSWVLFWELVLSSREPNLLQALGHFMIVILLCKLFETKSSRDDAQILTLSLLITVTGSIFDSSPFFGFVLAVYLALGLYTVLVFHLRVEVERAQSHQAPAINAALPAEPELRRDLRRLTCGSGAVLLVLATVVFLIIPRGRGRDMLGVWTLRSRQSVSGFSDRVSFDDFTRLHNSSAVVMHVRLEQATSPDVGVEMGQPYFRGATLNRYDLKIHQWTRSLAMYSGVSDRPFHEQVEFLDPAQYTPSSLITQHYTVMPTAGNVLFALGPPARMRSQQIHSVAFSRQDMTLMFRGPLTENLEYEVDTPLLYANEVRLKTDAGPESRPLRVPPEIAALAQQVAGDLWPEGRTLSGDQTHNLVGRFEAYLRSHYPYSLETHWVDQHLDPIADFLVNRQNIGGHCEYFASALVMMCAAAGLPAHMVTGYHGGEFNPMMGGVYVVRQYHAHAWAEVYLPGNGWTLFDPTPPANEPPATVWSDFKHWVQQISELVNRDWLNGVVSFDNDARHRLAQRLFGGWRGRFAALTSELRWCGSHFFDLLFGRRTLWPVRTGLVLLILAVLAGMGWLLRRYHRYRTSAVRALLRHLDRPTQRRLAYDLAFYDDLLRILPRSGLKRPATRTPQEYVRSVSAHLGRDLPQAAWLVQVFYDLRFGRTPSTPQLQARIAAALQLVDQALSRRTRESRSASPT